MTFPRPVNKSLGILQRKPEEEAVPESGDAEAKKPRQDPEKSDVDGSGDAKVTNGQANEKEHSPEQKTDDTVKPEVYFSVKHKIFSPASHTR